MSESALTATLSGPENIVAKLRHTLRADQVCDDPETLEAARADRSGLRSDSSPSVVVYAESLEDVCAVVALAQTHHAPIVVRGAGTGLAGGGFASAGEIVLSLERMNHVLEINEEEGYAVVEAGVLNGSFDAMLRGRGFWFAPDPASRDISTIGGNISTNAGGLMCAKYGVTREAVLGLTVVLADGSVIETGRRTVKGVTGLDLTALLTGSEGTLGIIVRACVRIRRLVAGDTVTLSAYFPSARQAAHACSAIGRANLTPMVMELMDARCLEAVHQHLKLSAPPPSSSHVLVQFDGPSASLEAARAGEILEEHGGGLRIAADADEADELLRIRRSVHPALAALGTTLIEDVCVPRSRLGDMFEAIAQIETRWNIVIPTVAHAGDGNLHPNFISSTSDVPDELWDAASELFRAALELGGTLTGEHGVGVLKKRWLSDELGDAQVQLQKRIKSAFDPHNLLNPGKMFP